MMSKLTWYWACILSSWGDLGRQDYGTSGSNSASYHSLIAIHDTRVTRAYLTYKKKYIVTFSGTLFVTWWQWWKHRRCIRIHFSFWWHVINNILFQKRSRLYSAKRLAFGVFQTVIFFLHCYFCVPLVFFTEHPFVTCRKMPHRCLVQICHRLQRNTIISALNCIKV